MKKLFFILMLPLIALTSCGLSSESAYVDVIFKAQNDSRQLFLTSTHDQEIYKLCVDINDGDYKTELNRGISSGEKISIPLRDFTDKKNNRFDYERTKIVSITVWGELKNGKKTFCRLE